MSYGVARGCRIEVGYDTLEDAIDAIQSNTTHFCRPLNKERTHWEDPVLQEKYKIVLDNSMPLDDKSLFLLFREDLCCDTCPNDDEVFLQMIHEAKQIGAEIMKMKVLELAKQGKLSYDEVVRIELKKEDAGG
jgi:hypothetical protein